MRFTKMQGCGNDYIYINCFKEKVEDPSALAVMLSDRRFGIGGDGIILIKPSDGSDFMMDMYNLDGSRGKMCGNAIRCVGKYVYENGMTDKTELEIETLSGKKYLKLNVKDGIVDSVRVDMGFAKSSHAKLSALDREFDMTLVDVGNPHAVSYVDDVRSYPVEKYGSVLEYDKAFPDRANIEFVKLVDREHIEMRVWERGSGETFACGTGACASVYASMINGLTGSSVRVKMLGGELLIECTEDGHIFMTGPAVKVFEGEADLPLSGRTSGL
ncbi:MAG: diaminopimelate epimerase [Lachnospiraceae bacterium]|nr:diaminopimelate epimerase [Lachnospiraceae bacterium]